MLIRAKGVALMLVLLVTTGGGAKDAQPEAVPKLDGKKTYEEFRASIQSFPYTAPRERRDRIVQGYSTLDVGMTKDNVARVIGEPDYSRLSYGPKGPRMTWQGSSWVYYLSKRDDGANTRDAIVHVSFNTDDRAVWIKAENIEGLREKGTPSTPRL